MEIRKEKYYVVIGMMRYGGGFASQLGKALNIADEENTQKIKDTWPDLWQQYLEMGKKAQQ